MRPLTKPTKPTHVLLFNGRAFHLEGKISNPAVSRQLLCKAALPLQHVGIPAARF